ncbi:cutinase family protein [Candidatus Saccharibacteria bacterium]|nr:cutinase family protein [Candidatus Saccharibacteria bacterium]
MKILNLMCAGAVVMTTWLAPFVGAAEAVNCPDVKVVFARGSGGERWVDQNYLAFRDELSALLGDSGLDIQFEDLDYPAVGIMNPLTLIGAYIGGGEAYEFGKSVNLGVDRLVEAVNNHCPATKYVVAGYSQGAMVVSKSLRRLNAEKVIYAATFGDPKIYLPEGAGLYPVACSGLGLSDYRQYVPDCRAYIGKLGTYMPYRPENFKGKYGTWCNKTDIFCSSYLSITSHVGYVADDLYADAARVIYGMVADEYGITRKVTTPHDTVIMIDSTGSMGRMIDKYRTEALRLAKETLDAGGRVALYDFRDYQEEYAPVQRCDFGCTIEEFETALQAITVDGGGDTPESVLGSAFHVMQELEWQKGATKSLVILTDANYHPTDFDPMRTTLDKVVRLSREIDPVNVYVVSEPGMGEVYNTLAELTGGKVVTDTESLSVLTDEILLRDDVLPRVEEWTDDGGELPWITITSVKYDGVTAQVAYETSNGLVMVALDDYILGVVEGESFTLDGLRLDAGGTLTIIPINNMRSGVPVSVELSKKTDVKLPLAPDTGRL